MPASSLPPDFGYELTAGFAGRLIRSKVRRIVQILELNPHDAEDLTQTLRLELLRRSPKFDPRRGDWRQFSSTVLSNVARTQFNSLSQNRAIVSLDDESLGLALADTLSEAAAHRHRFRKYSDNDSDFAADLESLSEQLDLDQLKLVQLLQVLNVTDAAKELDRPRSTVDSQIQKLREPLAGLNPENSEFAS